MTGFTTDDSAWMLRKLAEKAEDDGLSPDVAELAAGSRT